jgi:hypothetical protein
MIILISTVSRLFINCVAPPCSTSSHLGLKPYLSPQVYHPSKYMNSTGGRHASWTVHFLCVRLRCITVVSAIRVNETRSCDQLRIYSPFVIYFRERSVRSTYNALVWMDHATVGISSGVGRFVCLFCRVSHMACSIEKRKTLFIEPNCTT